MKVNINVLTIYLLAVHCTLILIWKYICHVFYSLRIFCFENYIDMSFLIFSVDNI